MKIHVLLEWAYELGRLRPVRGPKGGTEAEDSPVGRAAPRSQVGPSVGSGTRHSAFELCRLSS